MEWGCQWRAGCQWSGGANGAWHCKHTLRGFSWHPLLNRQAQEARGNKIIQTTPPIPTPPSHPQHHTRKENEKSIRRVSMSVRCQWRVWCQWRWVSMEWGVNGEGCQWSGCVNGAWRGTRSGIRHPYPIGRRSTAIEWSTLQPPRYIPRSIHHSLMHTAGGHTRKRE